MLKTSFCPWLGLTKAERVWDMLKACFSKQQHMQEDFVLLPLHTILEFLNFLWGEKRILKPQSVLKKLSLFKKFCFSFPISFFSPLTVSSVQFLTLELQ